MLLFIDMKLAVYFFLISYLLQGCIGTDVIDDLVTEKVEISNPLISLKVGDSFDLNYRYLNTVGMSESANVRWESSNEDIITINNEGRATAITHGSSTIKVTLVDNDLVMDEIDVKAGDQTVLAVAGTKLGTIASTSSYELMGDFSIANADGGVDISVAENYVASEALPGLYVYLSNNPSTVDGALEIGAVTVFSGAHTYNVTAENLTVDSYAYLLYFCKPFNVKVGHGEILD